MGYVGFDFEACRIGHSVANGSPPLRRFFGAVLLRRYAAEMGPHHLLHALALYREYNEDLIWGHGSITKFLDGASNNSNAIHFVVY